MDCFSCFIQSLLSALWLVDDSAAVSLRYVWTRDWMTTFLSFQLVPSVVLPAVFLVISWLVHVHSWTSAHLKPWTAQDVTTPCSSHSCLTDPDLLYCGKPSEVVPSFPFLPSLPHPSSLSSPSPSLFPSPLNPSSPPPFAPAQCVASQQQQHSDHATAQTQMITFSCSARAEPCTRGTLIFRAVPGPWVVQLGRAYFQ